MAEKITENKQDSINNQSNSSILTRIETILSKITEHKEALGILGIVISVIVTALWNLGCDFGYMGYANKFDIPMMYIQKDSSSLLVQLIIISAITFMVILPIYKLAEYNSSKKHRGLWHVFTLFISGVIFSIPFLLNWVFITFIADNIKDDNIEVVNNLVTVILSLTAVFAIISAFFFFLYISVILIFPFDNLSNSREKTTDDDKIHNKNANNCNEDVIAIQAEFGNTEIDKETEIQAESKDTEIDKATETQAESKDTEIDKATETQAESENTEIDKATETQAQSETTETVNEQKGVIKSLLVTVLCLAFALFAILMAVYSTGGLIAESKTNYRFLVEDLETEMKTGTMYHVILSETDTHYYLAESFIKLDNIDNIIFIGDNKQLTLHILTDYVTVIEKSEESFVREIDFSKVEIR